MKLTPVLLAASLVANAVLLGFVLRRPAATVAPTSPSIAADAAAKSAAASKELVALRAALASGDTAALTAAGMPPELARALSIGRAFDTFQARMRALRPNRSDGKYWRESRDNQSGLGAQRSKALRDFDQAVEAGYGEGIEAMFNERDPAYAVLPAAKRAQLLRIERDYSEMEQQIQEAEAGIQLPSDRDKLKLLRAEKDRDIAALLTPEERNQLDMRSSNTANQVRGRYGDAIQTEADYQKIYALQKAFDDRFNRPEGNPGGPPSADAQRARREAEQQLAEDIRAAIGPDQWAVAQRANDPDLRTLNSLAQRLPVPDGAADAVLAARGNYAAQSMQINANDSLSAQERRTQLQALATKAQNDLQTTLGADGGQVFAQRAQWINMLKNGQAFSTNPKDSPGASAAIGRTVFPVPPPRNATPPPPPPRG